MTRGTRLLLGLLYSERGMMEEAAEADVAPPQTSRADDAEAQVLAAACVLRPSVGKMPRTA